MSIIVATSEVTDGNMYIPENKSDTDIVQNRKRFLAKNNIGLEQATRVDILYEGTNYLRYREVGENELGQGMVDAAVESADALVTRDFNHALFLPLADCTGTVIYDPIQHILMLSHVGRHSLEQDGAYESVMYLVNQYGSRPDTLKVWLTPAPGHDSYPLWAFENRGFKEVVFEQLFKAGVLPTNVINNEADSSTDLRYFSHNQFLAGTRNNDGRHSIVAMMTK